MEEFANKQTKFAFDECCRCTRTMCTCVPMCVFLVYLCVHLVCACAFVCTSCSCVKKSCARVKSNNTEGETQPWMGIRQTGSKCTLGTQMHRLLRQLINTYPS